ncbi:MAG TPA: hypothetical protein VI112_10520, partial [Bacteroidia bacterium]
MSQLHQLIHACDEGERARLNALKLRGKEKEMFELVCACAEDAPPVNAEITRKLGISDTHL